MSKRSLTAEEKAKQDAARKGINALRAASRYHESVDAKEKRAHIANLTYMRQRGLLEALEDQAAEDYPRKEMAWSFDYTKLERNEAAPARPYQATLRVWVEGRQEYGPRGGRKDYIEAHWETVGSVAVPNWDYDGVDPLIAREPYERQLQNGYLDNDYHRRPWAHDEWRVLSGIEEEAAEMEACESLNEYHDGIEGAATFTFSGSRDWC